MRQAVENGFIPIRGHGAKMDISGITGTNALEPGRSITAQLLSAIPGLFDPKAGVAVKRWVDAAGDFYHNELLWRRVGDLQAGLYNNMFEENAGRMPPDAAAKLAARTANNFAGVLAPEDMSVFARKFANSVLFSRSYTLGIIGSLKNMITGMDRMTLAQIERDHGIQTMLQVKSIAQRKAIGIAFSDMALYYAGLSLTQSGLNVMLRHESVEDEAKSYVERFLTTFADISTHPTKALNPFNAFSSLMSNSENEPGKQDKILIGYQNDGTAIYSALPTGKTGGEMVGWMTDPASMVNRKLSTFVKPVIDIANNKDYSGRQIYNPYPQLPEDTLSNVAKMAFHVMAAQFPEKTFEAAYDLMHGTPTSDEKTVDVMQIVGPIAGLMLSHGYPGGPAGSEILKAKAIDKYNFDQVSSSLRSAIKEGRLDEAYNIMDKLHMDPKLQEFTVQSTLDPSAKFVKRGMQKYIQGLPETDQDRINRLILRGSQ